MFKKLLLTAALVAASANAFAAGVTYKLDPTHTNVLASWNHFGYSNPYANFGDVEGTLVYDAADVSKSSVEVTLPLSGLNGFSDKFNAHLRSADIFDIATFPTATFKSTKVESAGNGKLKITGDLTIKGITKPVTLEVEFGGRNTDPWGNEKLAFALNGRINRKEWGLNWNAALETGGVLVSDEVRISAELQFAKQ